MIGDGGGSPVMSGSEPVSWNPVQISLIVVSVRKHEGPKVFRKSLGLPIAFVGESVAPRGVTVCHNRFYNGIEKLVYQFEACVLPREEWTHHAHITVALWYLRHHSRPEATQLIRNGIQQYNLSCGVVTTETGGYHETITLFYIWAVDKFLNENDKNRPLEELLDEFITQHGHKSYPLEFYSRERLLSREARFGWVEPDLKALE